MAGQGWLQSYAFLPVWQDAAAVVLSAQSRGGAILNQLVKGSHMVAPLEGWEAAAEELAAQDSGNVIISQRWAVA